MNSSRVKWDKFDFSYTLSKTDSFYDRIAGNWRSTHHLPLIGLAWMFYFRKMKISTTFVDYIRLALVFLSLLFSRFFLPHFLILSLPYFFPFLFLSYIFSQRLWIDQSKYEEIRMGFEPIRKWFYEDYKNNKYQGLLHSLIYIIRRICFVLLGMYIQ